MAKPNSEILSLWNSNDPEKRYDALTNWEEIARAKSYNNDYTDYDPICQRAMVLCRQLIDKIHRMKE